MRFLARGDDKTLPYFTVVEDNLQRDQHDWLSEREVCDWDLAREPWTDEDIYARLQGIRRGWRGQASGKDRALIRNTK